MDKLFILCSRGVILNHAAKVRKDNVLSKFLIKYRKYI